jgi:hypothetical protein
VDAIAVTATDLAGVHFGNIGAVGLGWEGTQPLVGEWLIRQMVIVPPPVTSVNLGHVLRFGLLNTVPTTQARMDLSEDVFPLLARGATSRPTLRIVTSGAVVQICGAFPIAPNGRRLIVEWLNTSSAEADLDVAFTLQRV